MQKRKSNKNLIKKEKSKNIFYFFTEKYKNQKINYIEKKPRYIY